LLVAVGHGVYAPGSKRVNKSLCRKIENAEVQSIDVCPGRSSTFVFPKTQKPQDLDFDPAASHLCPLRDIGLFGILATPASRSRQTRETAMSEHENGDPTAHHNPKTGGLWVNTKTGDASYSFSGIGISSL
jgi:hypothetical protein